MAASTFKDFTNNDIVNTKTLLHEAIPLTGTITSGTYMEGESNEINIKNYSHGMFQSVYDYPYLSSSANHLFDIAIGYSNTSGLSASANVQNAKKINIYNQMAQSLMGFDLTGNVQLFDDDGDLTGGTKLDACYFLNFSRLLTKDEIKKGSFSLVLGVNNVVTWVNSFNDLRQITITDSNAQNDYRVNAAAGEYGILYADSNINTNLATDDGTAKAGLIFYQAGVVVLTASIFKRATGIGGDGAGLLINSAYAIGHNPIVHPFVNTGLTGAFKNGSISGSADGLRQRIVNLSFNNTTELNSQIYFCRINHNDFNYSSNPTYLSNSKLRVKQQASDNPVSYITTVGLYSASRELLAVAKLSEPLKNDPTQDMTLRVRLDY
jgi:hypothetical protein